MPKTTKAKTRATRVLREAEARQLVEDADKYRLMQAQAMIDAYNRTKGAR